MSGDAEPRLVLAGWETRRLVEAIGVVAQLASTTPTVVGGLAVLCRVQRAHGATTDLDTVSPRVRTGRPLLEVLLGSPGAERADAVGVMVATSSGRVKVDVIEIADRPDAHEIEDPTDRLYEMSHT